MDDTISQLLWEMGRATVITLLVKKRFLPDGILTRRILLHVS